MRAYREDLTVNGQTSPDYLLPFVVHRIADVINENKRSITVLDVGCGSGKQSKNLQDKIGSKYFKKVVGVDWSQPVVDKHKYLNIFTDAVLCKSSTLPFEDKEFDVAISMENLEHLYNDDVINAIKEMKRVANYVIITTPLPIEVINIPWLDSEIPLAEQDEEPLSAEEYRVIEGAVHKSVVLPESMRDAGFKHYGNYHGYYFAKSDEIDLDKIKFIGLDEEDVDEDFNFNKLYVNLLKRSRALSDKL